MAEPPWYQEVDHTGDAGIRVVADDLSTLFERAAWATFNIIAELSDVKAVTACSIRVEGTDRDNLLVKWLSELNFLHLTRKLLFVQFKVELAGDTSLAAEAWGEPIDLKRHEIYTEVKAVTYHGLVVEQCPEGWTAQVIFDM